ncbi:MAG TPA: LacI family DNA-binding transcriptional regulator [Sphaerochaeta sp.]|nr:LacI family DNA-binding transcriptional regulator [Sphaerochaeta sp.]
MKKRRVTQKEIADRVGVSTASVSMILAGKELERFSDETIDAVYTTSRELGYKGRSQRRHRNIVLIVCPSVINPYFATIIQGMEMEAKVQGMETVIFTTYWDLDKERAACEFAKDPLVVGVIFAMIPQQPELVRELNHLVPVIAVGDRQNEVGLDTVDVNNFNAGMLVARHLLHLGHRKIAYLSTSLSSEHSARVRRYEGLRFEIERFGSGAELSLFTTEISTERELNTVDIEHRTGVALAKRCIAEAPEVTAMVAVNDMVGYGVIDGIIQTGYTIPDDYSVCGFDNIYPSFFHGVGLTSVEHYIVQGGKSAFRLLLEKIEGTSPRSSESDAVVRVEYQSRLIIRSSTDVPRLTE